jgi:transposase
VVTDSDAIKLALKPYLGRLRRVGHEARALSPWPHPEFLKLGLPAVCLETQHVRSAPSAQRNKTDKADALGIANFMRIGWFRRAHIKSEACYRLRLLLTHRCNLKRFMQVLGVGPIAALSFMTAIDDPSRFKRLRDVAAHFGLTSRRWQSGSSIDVQGRISKAGDGDVRRALYEAASALLTRFEVCRSPGARAIARPALRSPASSA